MWFKTFLIGIIAISAFLDIVNIGKDREPITSFNGAIIALIDCLLMIGIWYYL